MTSQFPGIADRLAAACEAAYGAGEAVMARYGETGGVAKFDGSPVTDADRAADRVILQHLVARFPDDGFLSEERRDSTARLEAAGIWIIDPLDGTKEFLAQNGEFAVMIGFAVRGQAVLGVVHLPASNRLYYAVRGGGAWVRIAGVEHKLRCAPASAEAPRMVASRSHSEPLVEDISELLGITDVEPCGSVGVKCARIAEGTRDLYVHPVPYLKEWDTCAPEVIVRESGGEVTDCMGRPLTYNKPDPVQPHGIVVRAPRCGSEMLEAIVGLYTRNIALDPAGETA